MFCINLFLKLIFYSNLIDDLMKENQNKERFIQYLMKNSKKKKIGYKILENYPVINII